MAHEKVKYELRRDLIKTALRYNNDKSVEKPKEALEHMTTFKPFNIRELEYDVWQAGYVHVREDIK